MATAIGSLQQHRALPSSSPGEDVVSNYLQPLEDTALSSDFTFADKSETEITNFEEASSLLLLDEVKALAKDTRVTGKNKQELLIGLRRLSRQQTTLIRSDTTESNKSAASF